MAEAVQLHDATDTTLDSEPVKPSYGPGATAEWKGAKEDLDGNRIANIFNSILDNAKNYRQRYEAEIIKSFAQYNGDLMDSGKAEWQSQIHIPKAAQAVDTTVARIVSAIFQTEDWFDIVPYIGADDTKVDRAKRLIKWQWQKAKARGPITEAVKNAVICGYGPLKVHFGSDITPVVEARWVPNNPLKMLGIEIPMGAKPQFVRGQKKTNRLKLEPILPLNLWIDRRGRWAIQRVKKSLSELWELTKEVKDPVTGQVLRPAVYDAEEVAKVRPGTVDTMTENLVATIRRETPQMTYDQDIDVFEFWGDFIDPANGVTLYPSIFATFVQQWCIRKPQAIPFHHCRLPFINFLSMQLPGQVYPYGILHQGMKIQDSLDRQWGVALDKAMLQVPTLEVFPMGARSPAELMPDRLKFTPGKTWTRKRADQAIFYPVEGFKPPDNSDFALIDRLNREYDGSNKVNEFATGMPTSDNRKTKEEVVQRVSATDQAFNDTAVFIESEALSPLLEMIYSLMVQYEDQYDDQSLLRMFGDKPEDLAAIKGLKTMSPEERWMAMRLDAEFRVVGITNRITQQDRLNRLMNFFRVIQADPTMSVLINKFEALRWFRLCLDLPTSLVLEQSEAVLQALQQAQLAMIMGMGGQKSQGGGAIAEGQNPHNNATAAQADAGYAAENPEEGPRPQ